MLVALAALCCAAVKCSTGTPLSSNTDTETHTLHGRVIGIADGDTLTLLVDHEQVRVRLAEIDAPEFDQPYGRKSKAALSALAFKKQARVEVSDIDRYGRSVGAVFVDGTNLNREMVREGHAWAYTRYSQTTEFIELEDGARAAKRGLWALPESQREPPWVWRHSARASQHMAGPIACGTRTHCSEMASCEEARLYLERCSVNSLDGDGDGIPCESLCAAAR